MLKRLDINCDLGEGLTNDEVLMPYLDSCNIACGGHAGDENSILKAIQSAKQHQVKIGAHPSFPDRANFGRKVIDISEDELKNSLKAQLDLFFEIAAKQGLKVNHIKPHGALYNLAAKNKTIASLILGLIKDSFQGTTLYCPPQSEMEMLAKKYEVTVFREVFADRSYQDDGSLTSRDLPNAVLVSSDAVILHLKWIIEKSRIKTVSGKTIPVLADTVCIHGDNPAALSILQAIHKTFA
ncbi:5-oxoprolinase subunit PxpA [Mongoliibacter ruber]|uniref:UPF0271 protein n=1 Tax=Mongoliibacter ruber TaxID=1750599 RepID=A0A2T0WUG9_9BACT|nr:5-oxoprolinase subunit PxpA [Mongoliibacter ruber]PRY90356.1 UPF0271 protein [Mongoliibacter ruber]